MNTTIKTKMNNYTDYPITIGVRIRLTSEQKDEIKQSYDAALYAETGHQDKQGIGGVTVSTNYTADTLTRAMGCDRYTLGSFLGSNERVQVGMLRRWEKTLGIKIIDKKTLDATWKDYVKFVLEE